MTHSITDAGADRIFVDGPSDARGDASLRFRYFTYPTPDGLVSGCDMSISFSLDAPVGRVWPHFKDFNLWQPHHYYSGVLGDLEGQSFRIGTRPNDPTSYAPYPYQVLRVIPEYAIVIAQPVEEHRNGGVSRGFHLFQLSEREGRTTITIFLEHATRTTDKTVEQAIGYWNDMAPEWLRKWRDEFIPALRKLV